MAEPTRSGIPTTYRSTRFRSRLEARWAAFFDLAGWSWTYEPLGAAGYIPDFLIGGADPFFVEVGPCVIEDDYIQKTAKPGSVADELGHDVLVVGVSPLARLSIQTIAPAFGYTIGDPVAGLMGRGLHWSGGIWSPCDKGLAVFHATNSFGHRPCADSTYGGHPTTLDRWVIEQLWAEAGNAVQWNRAA